MRNRKWYPPTAEERAEHVKTLTRLAERILVRSCQIPIWFVLLSGFPEDQPLPIER